LISNIDHRMFEKLAGGPLDIRIGTHQVSRVVSTYADASPGEVCALFGSTDHLEIAANGASAAEALDAGRGALVHVARRA
jgi:S-adenosylmethionine hydrolase